MKSFLIILFIVTGFCSKSEIAQTESNSTEQEIRCALCRIKKKDYAGAENDLNNILQKEPQNIYAQRLLPSTLYSQIKKDDKSPENIARIHKTIQVLDEFIKNNKVSVEERSHANSIIIQLYGKLSDQEKTNELLKKAGDENLTAQERSQFYVRLAWQPNDCASEILAGKTKPAKPEIEKAAGCISKGFEYINQALTLNAENDSAWLYKSALGRLTVKISGFENDQLQKNKAQKEADEAYQKYKTLVAKRSEEEQKNFKADLERRTAANKKPTYQEAYSQELVNYKVEKPLDELVKTWDQHFGDAFLVAPLESTEDQEAAQKTPENTDDQKHDLKSFSPKEGELTAELPDNVRLVESSAGAHIYNAGSEGVKYFLLIQPKDAIQTPNTDSAVINMLAWIYVRQQQMFGAENSYEINFLRNTNFGSSSGKIYQYSSDSCACEFRGTLLVVVGQKNNYVIDVQGAGEQDVRAQQFMKSLAFNFSK